MYVYLLQSTTSTDELCVYGFGGTSAACPMVAGAISLTLEAKLALLHYEQCFLNKYISQHISCASHINHVSCIAMPPPLLVRERIINDTLLHSLSANLTWRDVMYLVVYTSDTSITAAGSYTTNGAGRKFSPKFGFGILDTEAVVARARHWINVPPQIEHIRIPSRPSGLVY